MKTETILLITILLGLTGCSTVRQVKVVEHATHDTLYINQLHYDSVYVQNNLIEEYHPALDASTAIRVDTVIIHDLQREYKYRLLRDTIRNVRIDSIPVVHKVEVVKTVKAVPAVYKWALGICIVLIVIIIAMIAIRVINNIRIL